MTQKTSIPDSDSSSSLHSVLALLSTGADSNSRTREELGDALGLTRTPKLLKDAYRELINFMRNQKEILFNNEIFMTSSLTAKDEFVNEVFKHFGTNTSYFFDDKIEESRKRINKIISSRTAGRVDEAIEELDSDTKLLIINTLFFKGKWTVPFENTKKGPFQTPCGEKLVDMMNVLSEGIKIEKLKPKNKRFEEMEMIKIPTIGTNGTSNYELRIVMGPEQFKDKGINVLIDLITREQIPNIFLESHGEDLKGEVSLTLPKFLLESKIDVSQHLKNSGVKTLFTGKIISK